MIGPAMTRTMRERKKQETKEGNRFYDSGPESEEIQKLNKRFMRSHGSSSLVSLVEMLMTAYYGLRLAERMG
jgi:hypothetical protein